MFTNHTEYTACFRDIARRHVDIAHTEEESHFARITLSSDPYLSAQAQIDEFVDGIRSELHTPLLLLVAYDANYADNMGDDKKKVFNGAFIILDLPERGEPDNLETVYDKTEKIGEDILALMVNVLDENPELGFFPLESSASEKMAKIANRFYGTRFTFSLQQSAEELLTFNPSKFID